MAAACTDLVQQQAANEAFARGKALIATGPVALKEWELHSRRTNASKAAAKPVGASSGVRAAPDALAQTSLIRKPQVQRLKCLTLTPWLVTLLATALLAGCAAAPKEAFNREQATRIKTVVIAQRPNQMDYMVDIVGHPGQSFGLIGALVEAVDIGSKTKQLTAVLGPGEVRLQDRFSAALRERLTAAGYVTHIIQLPSIPSQDADLLAQVKALASADAVVAVGMSGSYVAAGVSTQYFPRVSVTLRMVDLASGMVLYRESLDYGFPPQSQGSIQLPSDPKYRFANFEALLADPALARDGLIAGLIPLAQQIAADLKPK